MDTARYERHVKLKEIGLNKQKALSKKRICIVGCGGLGSIAAPYLAGAGVGHILLIDGDTPDLSNVHRQVFFKGHEKSSKAELMALHLKKLNPLIDIDFASVMLNKENIPDLFSGIDLVLDCTDDIHTKYLCNDFCHLNKIPLVYASIYKFEGLLTFFINKNEHSIHLRDLYPEADTKIPNCAETGVLNTLAGTMGLMQANEALKYLLSIGSNLIGRLLSYDALDNSQNIIQLSKTWRSDIGETFKRTSYQYETCDDTAEINFKDYLSSKDQYKLICILEKEEFVAIDKNVIHTPLSEIDIKSWQITGKQKILFYCRTGQRSSTLVRELSLLDPNLEIYSLKGGLKAVLKEEFKDQGLEFTQ